MLWYKAWLESRIWTLVPILALGAICLLTISSYRHAPESWRNDVPAVQGLEAQERRAVSRGDFHDYVWAQLIHTQMSLLVPWFALFLASNGIVSFGSCGIGKEMLSSTYTLSLPVSRRRLLLVRAAVGAAEMAALVLVVFILLPVGAALADQRFSAGDAAIYAFLAITGGLAFYSVSVLLSALLSPIGQWITCSGGFGVLWVLSRRVDSFRGLFQLISGESYFRYGSLPWPGIAFSIAVSVAMVFAATLVVERRDF